MTTTQVQTLIGFHAVSSALKGAAGDIEWLRVAQNSRNKRLHEIESRASGAGIKIIKSTPAELDLLAGQQRHQGVIIVLNSITYNVKNLSIVHLIYSFIIPS